MFTCRCYDDSYFSPEFPCPIIWATFAVALLAGSTWLAAVSMAAASLATAQTATKKNKSKARSVINSQCEEVIAL